MWRNGMPVTLGCSRVKEKIPKLGCIRNFGNLETQPFFSSKTQVFPIKNKTPEKLSCQKVVQFTYECFQLYTSFPVSPHAHLTLQKSKVQNETMSAALSGKTGNKQKVPHLERSKAKAQISPRNGVILMGKTIYPTCRIITRGIGRSASVISSILSKFDHCLTL